MITDWRWLKLSVLKDAAKAIKYAAWLAFLAAAFTAVLSVLALFGIKVMANSPWNFLDVLILSGLGFGLVKKSRICAALICVYFVVNQALTFLAIFQANVFSSQSFAMAFWWALIFGTIYLNGARGAFAYHRLNNNNEMGNKLRREPNGSETSPSRASAGSSHRGQKRTFLWVGIVSGIFIAIALSVFIANEIKPKASSRIPVRLSDGQEGTIDPAEYDPKHMSVMPVDPLGDPELDEAAKAQLSIRDLKNEEQHGSIYVSGEIYNPTKITFDNVYLSATVSNARKVVIIRQDIFIGCCANASQATPFNFSLKKPVDYWGTPGNQFGSAIGSGGYVHVVFNRPFLKRKVSVDDFQPTQSVGASVVPQQTAPRWIELMPYYVGGGLLALLCAFGIYRFLKWKKSHPSKLNSHQRQIRSAWIFSIIWSVWILSVVGGDYEPASDKLLKILTATLICGVFGFLRHISLREKPKQ